VLAKTSASERILLDSGLEVTKQEGSVFDEGLKMDVSRRESLLYVDGCKRFR